MHNEFQTYKDYGLVGVNSNFDMQKILPYRELEDQIISVRIVKYIYANPGATREDIL